MKRFILIACAMSTALLVVFIARQAIKHPKNNSPTLVATREMIKTYVDIKTRTVTSKEYIDLALTQSPTGLQELSSLQQNQLTKKLEEFFDAYSSGSFDAYKKFRLQWNYSVGNTLSTLVQKVSSEKGVALTNNEEIMRFAWEHYNGTNRINQFDPKSIILSVTNRHDLNMSWRRPGNLLGFTNTTMRCWDSAAQYDISPEKVLLKNGSILMVTLDQYARFNDANRGPAVPLRLVFYWDNEKSDWAPLALCTIMKVNNFNTIF